MSRELADDEVLQVLRAGRIEVLGRIPDASNAVLRAVVRLDGVDVDCVYKPIAGERPLWDFPDGTLAPREVAAYAVSAASGWAIVPPTVLRDGPAGSGMCQQWIEVEQADDDRLLAVVREPGDGWLPVAGVELADGSEGLLAHRDDARLRRIAAFDLVVNNADRKGRHLLPATGGHVHGIDHGVSFHTDPKVRTLLWGFTDQPLGDEIEAALEKLAADLASGTLASSLPELLAPDEVRAVADRIADLRTGKVFPEPTGQWPPLPWPPI